MQPSPIHAWLSLVMLMVTTQTTSAAAVPVVRAPWGIIQGVGVEGDAGRKLSGYLGIPYALPPVGDLRFQRPRPHPGPGDGEVFVADTMLPACMQMKPGLIPASREVGEDCLMLNVFVPPGAEDDPTPYAVMFFIHGGGFAMGDASFYQPSKLVVDGDVIVVVIQYRLGSFGFFTSGDDALPGNQGLWDQNLALRWVKDNIAAFNGDPNTITVFGESAGSMSSALQMMSPQSAGLMKRVILQSGSPQAVSMLSETFDIPTVFREVVELFQCPEGASDELLACLNQQPAEAFLNQTLQYNAKSSTGGFFYPVVDGEFIPGDLRRLVQDEQYAAEQGLGEVDVLTGFNSQEGSLVLMMVTMLGQPPDMLTSSSFFSTLVGQCLLFNNIAPTDALRKTVEFFYLGADYGTNGTIPHQAMADLYGDCLLTTPIIEWTRLLSASPHTARRYLYVMDHAFHFNQQGPVPGSHHADELFMEFDNSMMEDEIFAKLNKTWLTPEEVPLAETFVQIVTSFAKTGNPNQAVKAKLGGDWPEFSSDSEAYLSVSTAMSVLRNIGPYKDRAALWLKLVPELNALNSPTPTDDGKEAEQAKEKDEL